MLSRGNRASSGGELHSSPWMENPMRQKKDEEKDQNEDTEAPRGDALYALGVPCTEIMLESLDSVHFMH